MYNLILARLPRRISGPALSSSDPFGHGLDESLWRCGHRLPLRVHELDLGRPVVLVGVVDGRGELSLGLLKHELLLTEDLALKRRFEIDSISNIFCSNLRNSNLIVV